MKKTTKIGFDKVIMQAGDGFGKLAKQLRKNHKQVIKLLSRWENYRIGMGGAAVSSADTGAFGSGIELMRFNVQTENANDAANAIVVW
jgi:phosphoribosylformylglycinamidine synthase